MASLTDKKLHEKILARFTGYGELEQFVFFELTLTLPHIASSELPLTQVSFKLIEKMISLGRREELVTAVLSATGGGLPARADEERHLAKLIADAEAKAAWYSPVSGFAQSPVRGKRQLNPHMTPLLHCYARKAEEPVRRGTYGDIVKAFPDAPRAALLGDPGAGKSTALWTLALHLAQRALRVPAAPLPLLVGLGGWTGDEPLAAYLANAAPEIGWAIQGLSKAGRLVLLLDGLNEVPTAKRTAKAKDVASLQAVLDRHTPVIVSCRRDDYTGDLDLGIDTLTLEPMSPPQIRAAVHKWVTDDGKPAELADKFFWQLSGDERLGEVFAKWIAAGATEAQFWSAGDPKEHDAVYKQTTGDDDQLWRKLVLGRGTLLRLAENPFMLTMLFGVWEGKHELPRNRGELFGKFVICLLGREHLLIPDSESPTREGEDLLKGLSDLAWRMQRERGGAGTGDFGVLTVVSEADALAALGRGLLKKAVDGTILEGGAELRFRHQLLQEYFTARALQAQFHETAAAELWPPDRWWERSGWEETAVLLAGVNAGDCTAVIRWLADAQPEVAAQCIEESGARFADQNNLRLELQAAWQHRLAGPGRDARPEARAAVGRALGRLNLDTRIGVGLVDGVPDIDWVEIPAGEFVYQEEGERRRIERFLIARYPVTNAQFQAFVEAKDGYSDERWWQGLTEPVREPARPEWSEANHPRETVSWYEAMAFCAWLSAKTGRAVTLPTEWQWERAARGTDGREYPWGNDYVDGYANIREDLYGLGRTSPVGIYPEGASADRVLDLCGNVWEWCLNEYEDAERVQPGGTMPRGLRGGSWHDVQDDARAAFRCGLGPGGRGNEFGLRVVCSPPSLDTETLTAER